MTLAVNENSTLPSLSGGLYAFFFDVDGTLATIESQPELVSIPAPVRQHLQQISNLSQGALALVSGRPIAQLDALVAPLEASAAGVHGAERRDASGRVHRHTLPADIAQTLHIELQQTLDQWPGTLLEVKGMAFALHYRNAPDYENAIMQLAEDAVARFPVLALQPGKCVVELKPVGIDKGAAVREFMQEAPFIGRIPVFVGDDLTDEKGFLAVNAMQGISVKVGEGTSHARYRLSSVDAVWHWLSQLLLQLEHDIVGKESRL